MNDVLSMTRAELVAEVMQRRTLLADAPTEKEIRLEAFSLRYTGRPAGSEMLMRCYRALGYGGPPSFGGLPLDGGAECGPAEDQQDEE